MNPNHIDYKRTREWVLYRLRTRVEKKENGCIEWQGSRTTQGYGTIAITPKGERTRLALCHRILWEFTHKVELLRSQYVCHRCDNPCCVNIKHLFLGSAHDNSMDMSRKGRGAYQGQKRPYTARKKYKKHTRVRKYTDEQITEIRNFEGDWSRKAWEMGMSFAYAWKIRNGRAKTLVK